MKNRLLGLALAVVAGCSDAAGPGDIAISLSPTTSTFKAGEPMGINVTVTNIGRRPHTLTATGCPRVFQVFGDGGRVDIGGELCTLVGRLTPLAPGDSYTFHYDWTGEKISFTNGTSVRTPLPTGSYTIRGNVAMGDLGVISAGMASVYILPP